MKHLFVVNPKAGIKDSSEKIIEEIKNRFVDDEYYVHLTLKSGEAIEFVRNYLQEHSDETVRVYSCGGDGTLNEVVNGVYGFKNAEITCYPCGSGNDFLKCFNNNEKFLDIDSLLRGTAIFSDVLKVNGRYTLNIFNIGVDSNVVVKQKKIKKWPLVNGKMAYKLGLMLAFFGKISSIYKLTIDDEIIYDGKGMLCAIANGICYGGGYYCAPNAKIDDGLLDVCLVKKVSRLNFLCMVGKYKKGKHLEDKRVKKHIIYKQGHKVHLELDKELPYSIDGEIIFSKTIDVEVIPHCIKFVIPTECKEM